WLFARHRHDHRDRRQRRGRDHHAATQAVVPFRLLPGEPVADLRSFDIQLVSDALAGDELFTLEESVPGSEGKKRWCSLRERIDFAPVERFLTVLLESLTPPDGHWTWFVDRLQLEGDKPESHLTLEGHDQLLQLGGRLSIFELERGELEHYAR